jgi:DNA polymerase-4
MGLDEAYLDLSELHSPRAAMRRLVADIHAQTGMNASVGIGPNRVVAKVASDAEKPNGFVVLSREQACARFAERPPGLVPGIGPKTAARLERLGITTLGQLARADEEVLAATFGGRQGPWLRGRGAFEGSDVVEPVREAVSESRERTFDVDIADHVELAAILEKLAEQLCDGLRRHERAGRTIAIKVRLDDWTTVTRARSIEERTNDPVVVTPVVLDLFRAYAPERPVRLLGVRLAAFEDAPALQAAADGPQQLALL